jgi:diguanylate cyclase (GGDEF)-like protein
VATDAQGKRQRLLELRRKYAEGLPARLAGIEASVTAARAGDPPDWHVLFRALHAIAGSAGTFGFKALGAKARELEDMVLSCRDGGTPESACVGSLVDGLLELRATAQAELDSAISAAAGAENSEPAAPAGRSGLVFVVDDDAALAAEIARQIETFGYTTRTFTNRADAIEAAAAQPPAAAVLDIMLPEGELAGPEIAQAIRFFSQRAIPVVFVSSRSDWTARLAATRVGGAAYLTKPVEITELLDRLDLLLQRRPADAYRVLIVEDEEILAEHYAEVLRGAGMQVEVLHDPSRLIETIPAFAPELILMDLYMPGCTGFEAAKVLRQIDEYLSIPIVFLSTESDSGRQLSAMQIGGDDFLRKPVPEDRLVAAVAMRAERFRRIRTLMLCDSLTGLLNHVAFKLRLESELARAQRQNAPLAVAMIDIDHFKSVNDRFGHPAGDRVIKALSRLMTLRLRKSDIVGRYGGEEFAVVLPDTSIEDALPVIDKLRDEFSRLAFRRDGDAFSCTLSAGLAGATPNEDPAELLAAADKALYDAKHGGRNRVCRG